MDNLKMGIMYLAKTDVNKLNETLKAYQRYVDLIKQLQLPPNSPAIKLREQYLAEVDKIEDFIQKHSRKYDELEMGTQSSDDYDSEF
jgi:hypothetical protein